METVIEENREYLESGYWVDARTIQELDRVWIEEEPDDGLYEEHRFCSLCVAVDENEAKVLFIKTNGNPIVLGWLDYETESRRPEFRLFDFSDPEELPLDKIDIKEAISKVEEMGETEIHTKKNAQTSDN